MTTPKTITLTPQKCEVCDSRSDLLRCDGCHVAFYCGSDHQRLHWRSHGYACLNIRAARMVLSKQGSTLPPRAFEEHVGNFWHIPGTRRYMLGRAYLVDALLLHFPRHQVTVHTALDHILDMLRLDRSDTMILRKITPALMLRLGRDRDAYDFVNWCTTRARADNDNFDWPGTELPHPNFQEHPDMWGGNFGMQHAILMVLIKLRVLLRLRDSQNTLRALQTFTLPREIVDQVRLELLAGSLLAGDRDNASFDTGMGAYWIGLMRGQIWRLVSIVKDEEPDFWPRLLAIKDKHLELEKPDAFSLKPQEKAEFMAWDETPGALDELAVIWSRQSRRT